MAVPGFVEPHIHLDKALISERAPVNVSGTLTEAIEILWEIKRNYTVDEIADRASRVLARALDERRLEAADPCRRRSDRRHAPGRRADPRPRALSRSDGYPDRRISAGRHRQIARHRSADAAR